MDNPELLISHLTLAVPLAINDLLRSGGITDRHVEQAQRYMQTIREDGASESILYQMPGQTQTSISRLTECLAVMAFTPGGVRFGEMNFEVQAEASPCLVRDIDDFLAAIEPFRIAMEREERESPLRAEYIVSAQDRSAPLPDQVEQPSLFEPIA